MNTRQINRKKAKELKLTTTNVAGKILIIFKSHIGNKNAINARELFKKVYGRYINKEEIVDELRWHYIGKAMHYLRRNSNCFITPERREGLGWYYFVIKTEADADCYADVLDGLIIAMEKAKDQGYRYVESKGYKQTWVITPRKQNKLIGDGKNDN